jgi:hypothetical protein
MVLVFVFYLTNKHLYSDRIQKARYVACCQSDRLCIADNSCCSLYMAGYRIIYEVLMLLFNALNRYFFLKFTPKRISALVDKEAQITGC